MRLVLSYVCFIPNVPTHQIINVYLCVSVPVLVICNDGPGRLNRRCSSKVRSILVSYFKHMRLNVNAKGSFDVEKMNIY